MKNYIFDREKDDFLKDDDGQRIFFGSSDDVYKFLKAQHFTDDFINKNFYIMKAIKIIPLDEMSAITTQHPLFTEAALAVIKEQKGSRSLLQRRLKIGYAEACSLMNDLHTAGVVGEEQRPFPRKVLVETVEDFMLNIHNPQQKTPA
jgi:DNA segregation ATPase FtsK/SpoIIIE-like protein